MCNSESISIYNASINSQTSTNGAGGTVSLSAPNIDLTDSSLFATTSVGGGSGGDILINASGQVLLWGTSLNAFTWGDGNAGNITIVGDTVNVPNGQVSTSTLGAGQAGSITLQGNSNVTVGGVGQNIYGEEIKVEFVHRLRGEKRFKGISELVSQIHDDIRRTREILSSISLESN